MFLSLGNINMPSTSIMDSYAKDLTYIDNGTVNNIVLERGNASLGNSAALFDGYTIFFKPNYIGTLV